jgi:ABC-2 type transport system permease protein
MSSDARAERHGSAAWTVVGAQEVRDLWLGGSALLLALAFSLLLSIMSYLAATNTELNFLEQRESVSLLAQVSIGAGSLLALLAAADSFSGERERGTLESLLLTPASRLQLTVGKLLGALSLWVAAFAISIPYILFLGRGVGVAGDALAVGVLLGSLLAIFLASLGQIISIFAASNRVSLTLSLFLLLALFAPTQLPASAEQGWAGELLFRLNPVTAAERYVGRVIMQGEAGSQDAAWLVSPIVAAAVFAVVALFVGARFLRLRAGG